MQEKRSAAVSRKDYLDPINGISASAPPSLARSSQSRGLHRDHSTVSQASQAQQDTLSATDPMHKNANDALPPPNLLVPSGSFGSLFAAYFALAMGAPLGQLVPSISAASVVKELMKKSFSDVRPDWL